jgi:hypothetical protein
MHARLDISRRMLMTFCPLGPAPTTAIRIRDPEDATFFLPGPFTSLFFILRPSEWKFISFGPKGRFARYGLAQNGHNSFRARLSSIFRLPHLSTKRLYMKVAIPGMSRKLRPNIEALEPPGPVINGSA